MRGIVAALTLNAEFPATWRSHALSQHKWLGYACTALLDPGAAVHRFIEPFDGDVHVHLPRHLLSTLQQNVLVERIQTFTGHDGSDPVSGWN